MIACSPQAGREKYPRCSQSNCAGSRPAIGRPQGWRCAPPPPAAYGLDPVRSPVSMACKRSVGDRARRLWARSAQRVAAGIPFLPSCDQGVEDDDQLAHAGNERNLRLLSLGNQAVIEGLEHRVVLGGCAEAGHVDGVADPAAAALDVALAAPFAAIVIIRGGAQ